MTQITIKKVLLGSAAVLAQASGRALPTLKDANNLAPALAPAPTSTVAFGLNPDSQLVTPPCLSAAEVCPNPIVAPTHQALTLPAPQFMTRAKNLHQGQKLVGCPMGDFNVPVVIGDPAGDHETFQMVFDTGSSAMGVFSRGGKYEGFDPETFDLTLAPLPGPVFTNLPSTREGNETAIQSYGRGEWNGIVALDTVSIPGWPAVDMGFGEITSAEDMFLNDACDFEQNVPNVAHGILGMDTGSYSQEQPDIGAYLSSVQAETKDASFSLGLCDRNGTLVRGKPAAKHLASDFVYAAYQPGFFGHGIAVNGIRVGSTNLLFTNLDFGQTLVDSGSTAVSLPAPIAQAVFEQVALQTGQPGWRAIFQDGGCFELPRHISRGELDASLPTITLEVQDPDHADKVNTWTFSASNFLLTPTLSADGSTKVCAFVQAGQEGLTILGNIINIGNWVHYDKNIGLAQGKAICEEIE